MIYQKPKNITKIDMCIYIDNNVYKESFNQQVIYEYLYHIIRIIAKEHNYFNKSFYYDDFAIETATRVFLRLTNPNQFKLDENGEPKLKKIKSILNYLNAIMYGAKVDFEQKHYYQDIVIEDDYQPYSFDSLMNTADITTKISFKNSIENIHNIVKSEINNLRFIHNPIIKRHIYQSILLTILDRLTLTKCNYDYSVTLRNHNGIKEHQIERFYKKEKTNPVILFRLPPFWEGFVELQVRKVMIGISKELSESLGANYIDYSFLTDVIEDFRDSIIKDTYESE